MPGGSLPQPVTVKPLSEDRMINHVRLDTPLRPPSLPIIVCRHRNILSQPSPTYCCHPSIRGTPDKPVPIPIQRNVHFAIPIVISQHRQVLRQPFQSHVCVAHPLPLYGDETMAQAPENWIKSEG